MPRFSACLGLCLAIAAGDLPAAPVPDALSLSCPACHGSRDAPSALPGPYGHSRAELETMLWEFRATQRSGTAMPRLAAGMSDADIRRLAEHYGSAAPR